MNLEKKMEFDYDPRKLVVFNKGFEVVIFDNLKQAYEYFRIYRNIYSSENIRTIKRMDYEKFCDILLYDNEDHNSILVYTTIQDTPIKINIQKIKEEI
mgnify:CR=1 FL=1